MDTVCYASNASPQLATNNQSRYHHHSSMASEYSHDPGSDPSWSTSAQHHDETAKTAAALMAKRTHEDLERAMPHPEEYRLIIRQQPRYVEASETRNTSPRGKNKEEPKRRKAEWPLEPMPVIELTTGTENTNTLLNCHPHATMFAELHAESGRELEADELRGTRVSSLFRCKPDSKSLDENGYFIFPDLHVKHPGRYCLVFTLIELAFDDNDGSHFVARQNIQSAWFEVFEKGQLPPPTPPTSMNVSLDKGGAKIRYRKPPVTKPKEKQHWGADIEDATLSVGIKVIPKTKRKGQGQTPIGQLTTYSQQPPGAANSTFTIPMQPDSITYQTWNPGVLENQAPMWPAPPNQAYNMAPGYMTDPIHQVCECLTHPGYCQIHYGASAAIYQ